MHDRMVLMVAQNLNRHVMQALQAELHLVNSCMCRFEAINPGNLQSEFDLEMDPDIVHLIIQILSQLSEKGCDE